MESPAKEESVQQRVVMLPQHPCYANGEGYDHDWEYIDDSFDHEFGTEARGHWECLNCGGVDSEAEPPHYDDWLELDY